MGVTLHADDRLVMALMALATVAQLLAAAAALVQIPRAGRYRVAWGLVSAGLMLMVLRRVQPMQALLEGGPANVWDAVQALWISALLALGLLGVRELFAEVERQQGVLYQRATRDALTGLNNRQHTLQLGSREVERARRGHFPVSVLMVDIDHFKLVNDERGHMVGDEALKAVSRTLLAQLRASDVLGRLGGEEFLVLLPGEAEADARDVAERLRAAVEGSCAQSVGLTRPLTISVGRSLLVPDARPAEDQLAAAIQRADEALYQAKSEGRNRVVASPVPQLPPAE